ncbi:hypothetical protein GCM10028806_33980 [Spirosoma terrae]|uniref:Uncharacterized protein n=1 Tax=Spirosoma terrae TaxID=1968276 RepID=A0A6L9L9A2_9BACT|nr:hypothetical protein [Spirosoma terrae]NDU95711.1 hypothetical protein [Spirosoma terrae]
MSCKIPYLDNHYTGPELSRLRQLHNDTAREIRAAVDPQDTTSPLFPVREGFLRVGHPTSGLFTRQQPLIQTINQRLQAEHGVLDDILRIIPRTDAQGNPIWALAVDVRPLASPADQIQVNEPAPVADLSDRDLQTLLTDQINADHQQSIQDEWTEYVGEHADWFKDKFTRLKSTLQTYAQNIAQRAIESPDKRLTSNRLFAQVAQLTDNTTEAMAESLSKYVVETTNWLDKIDQNFFDPQKGVLARFKALQANTDLEASEKVDELKQLARQIGKSKHYLYLFNGIVQLRQEMAAAGYKPSARSTLNLGPEFRDALTDLLEGKLLSSSVASINELLSSPAVSEEALFRLIQERFGTDSSDLTVADGQQFTEDLKKLFDTYRIRTIDTILDSAVAKYGVLRDQLTDIHYQLVEDWLWPTLESRQTDIRKTIEAWKKDHPNETHPDEAFLLDKKKLKDLLRNADRDEDFVKTWVDAAVKSHDPVLAGVASIVSDAVYQAHGETVEIAQKLSAVRDELGWESQGLSASEIRDKHQAMTHSILVPHVSGQEADEAWIEAGNPVIPVTVFGETRQLKAHRKKAFLTEFDTAKWEAHQTAFYNQLPGRVSALWDIVMPQEDGVPDDRALFNFLLSRQGNPAYDAIRTRLFDNFRKGQKTTEPVLKDWAWSKDKPYLLRRNIKNTLIGQFYGEHQETVTGTERLQKLHENGVLDRQGRPTQPTTEHLSNYLRNNTSYQRIREDQDVAKLFASWKDKKNADWVDNLAGYHDGANRYLLVQKQVGESRQWEWVNLSSATAHQNVVGYAYWGGDMQRLRKDQYHVEAGGFAGLSKQAWQNLRQDEPMLGYYQKLYAAWDGAGYKLGGVGLKHGILPQVAAIETSATQLAKSRWDGFWDWLRGVLKLDYWQNLQLNQPDQATGRPAVEQYLNNDPVRRIPVRHVQFIDEDKLEMDLFRSVMAYRMGANQYRSMRQLEPQVQLLRTLVAGDSLLGINARTATQYNPEGLPARGRKLLEGLDNRLKTQGPRLNQKLLEFIDDVVYGEETHEAFLNMPGFGNLDLNKAAQGMMGYASFTSLAWNVTSMFGNVGMGLFSNWSEAISGRYSTAADAKAAMGDYWTAMRNGDFFKDLREPSLNKKSKLGQLTLYFDAIQGEAIDEFGELSRIGNAQKMQDRALYWTQSGAEHLIQTQSMVQLMRGYKLPSGKSLWEAVEHQPGEVVSWSSEVSDEILRDFQRRLHSVNKELHGHYNKLDKGMLQRRWLGKMAMMFKKYLYSSFRSRFSRRRFDWESGDVTEGYFRQYLAQLYKEVYDQKGIAQLAWYGLKNVALRPTAGALDALSGRRLSKNLEGFDQFVYGDATGDLRSAMYRTTFELAVFGMMGLLAAGLHALNEDDDDEDRSVVLLNLELFARRMADDVGMYLPWYIVPGHLGPVFTWDKALQIVKSPLAQIRSYDATVGLLGQLVGVEYGEEGINFTFNDQYNRSGPGYQQGDYKLENKLYKSIFAPFWQVMKLLNPEQQLQYLQMVFKNSR